VLRGRASDFGWIRIPARRPLPLRSTPKEKETGGGGGGATGASAAAKKNYREGLHRGGWPPALSGLINGIN
jgi:hypothetical protein